MLNTETLTGWITVVALCASGVACYGLAFSEALTASF